VTTLVWPSEAVPESVLTTLTGPGAPFELREEDVLGAPMLVVANRPKSLTELLHGAAERQGDRPYVIFPDRSYTFASILQPIAAVAAALRDRYGIGPGDRVAIVAPNTVEYALLFWATTALGAITVGLNGWWTGEEIAYAVEPTEPKVLFGDRRRLARLEGIDLPAEMPVVEFERDFAELEQHAPDAPFPDVAVDEDDPFVILFTSGTTGRPKGVMLSHRSNIHFLMATMLNGAIGMMTSREAGLPATPPVEHPIIISAAPMFHIAGLNCQLVASTLTGLTIVYPPAGKWQEETHLQLTQQHGATTWALVPTQLWRIVDHPDLDTYDTSTVRNVGGGSAVWPPELLRTVAERIPTAKAGTALGYGSTETTGLGTTLRPGPALEHTDSIGMASATMQVQVRDPLTDKPLPEGEVGEICLRGASCFLGYWRNPEATASALDEDRWYRTGDYGVIRNGYVHLEGRRQDLIIRGGENISPIEIENRLFEHPDVAEVAVVGIDHPKLGQEVVAFVVPHTPGALTADDVRTWVAATLAGFKVPSRVELRDELPHNASGKVLKHVLASPDASSGFVEDET
jgi:acyl-CoA synthetase (AMP-forming)/AMP-acid ligase II